MATVVQNVKKNKKEIILYCILFVIMFLLNRASLLGISVPFGAAFCFALIFFNKNPFIISLIYFFSFVLLNFSIKGIVISLNVVSSFLLMAMVFKILNKKIEKISVFLFYLISQVGYIYFNIGSSTQLIISIVLTFVSLMFLYISIQTLNVFNRGIQSRLTIDENICVSIFFIILFNGISNLYFLGINITNMLALFIILVAGKSVGKMVTIVLAVLMGFSVSLSLGITNYIALYSSFAVVVLAFRDYRKIFTSLAILFVDLIFGLFFNMVAYYTYLNLISILLVNIIYLCLPNKLFNLIKSYSCSYEGNLAKEYIIEDQKFFLKDKLLKLSMLFNQIQNTYKKLCVSEIDKKFVPDVLMEELLKKHCFNCINYYKCMEKKDIKEMIKQLFILGIEKGKVTLLDANNLITSECSKLKSLIVEINNLLLNYFEYEKKTKSSDEGKMLVANQIGEVSNIFKELSSQSVGGFNINKNMSKKVLDELTLNNIVVNEAIVLETKEGIEKVVLVVRNKDVVSPNIMVSMKAIFKIDFIKEISIMTKYAGWSVLSLVPSPKYDVSVGFAESSKNEQNVSGDNYSCIKLSNNKVLFAIGDGMGHGKKANDISAMALNLVENFYKSGFSSETIMSCINNVLLPAGEENFTTLDICIFDKSSAIIDFIKLGSSISIIKSDATSRLVSVDSLPIGIIEKVNFKTKRVVLKDQDVVVMASDGVVDSFDDANDYLNYVNNERVINTQMLANSILEESESRNIKHQDDKTVIVIKVNAKI